MLLQRYPKEIKFDSLNAALQTIEKPAESKLGDKPLMLYDGLCGFCTRSVQEILLYDQKGRIHFATLESKTAKGILARHPATIDADTVILVENAGKPTERVFLRSEAVLRIAKHLGGPFILLQTTRIIPRPLRDFFYDQFAKVRYKLFGKRETCMIPSARERERFLDLE